jgi:very-short-patch-repair endonuclease
MQAKAYLTTGRWQRMLPGVYATFTGPIGTHSRIWAAILYAGAGAAASHGTALWLWQILDDAPTVIDVVVPESRRVLRRPGLRVHRRRALDQGTVESLVHPSASPPRLRVEVAVLDHCDSATATVAIDLILRATQRRYTTAERLRRSIAHRQRLRWRSLLLEVLSDVESGVASALERRYLRDVERPHDLPPGIRNQPEARPQGGNRYRDVRYRAWQVIVELDGREAHPVDEKFRDMSRDNVAAVAGDAALRYGWRDVVGAPCAVAGQVAAVLRLRGWTGRPRLCGPNCAVMRPV